MPYLNLKITDDGVTTAQKAEIVRDFSETLVRVLSKRPEHIHIVIDEVAPENWGFSGLLTSVYRDRAGEK